MMQFAETIVLGAGIYFGIGAVVALAFLALGAPRLDAAAAGSGFFFRLAVFPGCAALWPYVLGRWLSGRKINRPAEGPGNNGSGNGGPGDGGAGEQTSANGSAER